MFRQIRRVRPDVACTTPVTAAFAAFKALGARRIGVLTPYSPEVNAVVRAYLDAHGVEVAAFATFDKRDDREAARISVGLDRRGDRGTGARSAAGCGVRVVHQPAAGRERGGDRGGGRDSGHLQRSRAGLALPAARGGERRGGGRGAIVRVPAVIVRTADRTDLVPVVARWLWEEFSRQSGRPLERVHERIAASTATCGPPQTFVLLVDDRPIGTASLVDHDLDTRPDLTPWLAGVFVVPEARGRGHAARLIGAVEAAGRAAAIPSLWL